MKHDDGSIRGRSDVLHEALKVQANSLGVEVPKMGSAVKCGIDEPLIGARFAALMLSHHCLLTPLSDITLSSLLCPILGRVPTHHRILPTIHL